MRTIEVVRDDHEKLRAELDACDAAVAQLPATRFVVEHFCVTLAALLHTHVEHERRLALEEPVDRMPLLASLLREHEEALVCLRAVIRLWSATPREGLQGLRLLIDQWAACLREQMGEQETGLRAWERHAWEMDPDPWRLGLDSETMVADMLQALPRRRCDRPWV